MPPEIAESWPRDRRATRIRPAQSLAAWRRVGLWLALLIATLACASGVFHRLDLRATDLLTRGLARLRNPTPVDDVAIVALDEMTLREVPQPLALLHPHIGAFLQSMADAGVRAVAVDLVLPDKSFDEVVGGYDLQLLRGIIALRSQATLVLARTVDESGRPRPIHAPFVAAAGEGGVGFAMFPLDPDGVVRRFDERLADDGSSVPSLVGALARRLGMTVSNGLLDFSRPRRWSVIPLRDVLARLRASDPEGMKRDFGGKIVILGSTLPWLDTYPVPAVPFDGTHRLNGVFIHAQVLQDLREHRLVAEWPLWASSLLGGTAAALTWAMSRSPRRTLTTVALCALAIPALAATSWNLGRSMPAAAILAVATSAALARLVAELATELGSRRRMRRLFAGYVSPGVMAELESGRLEGMASSRRFICVLFVDIRGFTPRSEVESPEKVTETLNKLFEMASEVIHRHGGTIKEFMGDGVMAFFGAPNTVNDPVRDGFSAAREIHSLLPSVNESLRQLNLAPLEIGMGAACGQAVVGHIGATDRHGYGAVGDCVNLASRLEGVSKQLRYSIVVSAQMAARLPQEELDSLGQQVIKGHSPVEAFGWPPRSSAGRAPEA